MTVSDIRLWADADAAGELLIIEQNDEVVVWPLEHWRTLLEAFARLEDWSQR